jgi:hypothetical protein
MTLKTLGGEPWAEKKSALPSNGIAISSNVDRFSVTTRMSVTGCDVCRVPLCNNKYCWNQYHWWGGLQVVR